MAPLLVGGQMDKKCMFGHIHKARELVRKQLGPDGTPIDRSGMGAPSTSTEFGNSTNSGDGDLPSISIPSSSETTVEAFPIVPTAVSEPVASPAEPVISSPTVEPEMPDEAPVFEPLALPGDSVTEPPAFEPIGDAGLPPLTEDTFFRSS